jgi:hypothetical protein
MKNNSFLLLSFVVISLVLSGFDKPKVVSNTYIQKVILQDTIEFSLPLDFKGDCEKECYKFIATGAILKLNGKQVKKG